MAKVYWNVKGISLVDYLKKGKTITAEYKSKLRFCGRELFHQDKASNHKAVVLIIKMYESQFEVVLDAQYSPNLIATDFSLFPIMKKTMMERNVDAISKSLPSQRPILKIWTKNICKGEMQPLKQLQRKSTNVRGTLNGF